MAQCVTFREKAGDVWAIIHAERADDQPQDGQKPKSSQKHQEQIVQYAFHWKAASLPDCVSRRKAVSVSRLQIANTSKPITDAIL